MFLSGRVLLKFKTLTFCLMGTRLVQGVLVVVVVVVVFPWRNCECFPNLINLILQWDKQTTFEKQSHMGSQVWAPAMRAERMTGLRALFSLSLSFSLCTDSKEPWVTGRRGRKILLFLSLCPSWIQDWDRRTRRTLKRGDSENTEDKGDDVYIKGLNDDTGA